MHQHGSDYLDLVARRYSCRRFRDEQISDDELGVLLEAARLSPSARNLQPTRLCVVQKAEGLAKIDRCTACRYGAPTVIIAAYDERRSSHPVPPKGPETCDFGDIDTAIALTNMENAAASLGLAACWVGAFDHDLVHELFRVPEPYRLVELLMVGYPDMEPSPKHGERRALAEMVAREAFSDAGVA